MATTRNSVVGSQQTNAKRQFEAEARDFLTGPVVSDVLLQKMVPQHNLNDPTISAGIDMMGQIELDIEKNAKHLPPDLFQGLYTFDSQPLEPSHLEWPWWPMQAIEEMESQLPETIPQRIEGDGSLSFGTLLSTVALPSSEPRSGSFRYQEPQQEAYYSSVRGADTVSPSFSSRSVSPGSLRGLEESEGSDYTSKRYLSSQDATYPKTHQRRRRPRKPSKENSEQRASGDVDNYQSNRSRHAKRDAASSGGNDDNSSHYRPVMACESDGEDATEMENPRRRRLTPDETDYLLRKFHLVEKPSAKERLQFAQDLKLAPRTIQIWFQNRRAKLKKETRLVRELYSKDLSEEEDSSTEEPDTNHAAQSIAKQQKDEAAKTRTATTWLDPPMPQLQTNDHLSQLCRSVWDEVQSTVDTAPFFPLTTTPSFETALSQQILEDADWFKGLDGGIGRSQFDLDTSLLMPSDAWTLQSAFALEPHYDFEESFRCSGSSSHISTCTPKDQASSRSGGQQTDHERQALAQRPSKGQPNAVSGLSFTRAKNPVPRHQRALTLVEIDPTEHTS